MELTVIRYSSGQNTTLGLLLINGKFAAYTLEDEFREEKVTGETRIPAGRYEVKLRAEGGKHAKYLEKFPDFHQGMLHVQNVPGFKWILIHIGNFEGDTDGCLLIGDGANTNIGQAGSITSSTQAYKRVYQIVANALTIGEEVWIQYLDNIPQETSSDEDDIELEEASVSAEQLNFRKSPNGQRMGVLFEGAEVDVVEERNGWSRVVSQGWVSSKWIENL